MTKLDCCLRASYQFSCTKSKKATDVENRMFRTYTKSDLRSLDFAVNRFLMKIFRSNNPEVIAECRRYFQFNLPSELIEKKTIKFERNYIYNRCTILRDMCVCVSETLLLCSALTNLNLFKLY